MKRLRIAGVLALCVGLSACNRAADRERDQDEAQAGDKALNGRPEAVTETGCLTASGDRFVLTNLEHGAGDAATETFQLVGKEDDLRPHVGKQLRVMGQAEPAKVAVVTETTPATESEPAGTSGSTEPKVSTETKARMEVRTLTVNSFEPTGASCAAETKGQ